MSRGVAPGISRSLQAGDIATDPAAKVDRPDEPKGPAIARPTRGSAIPKAGKKFSGEGGAAPQGV